MVFECVKHAEAVLVLDNLAYSYQIWMALQRTFIPDQEKAIALF